jgi:hypothetical protein
LPQSLSADLLALSKARVVSLMLSVISLYLSTTSDFLDLSILEGLEEEEPPLDLLPPPDPPELVEE